MPSNATSSGSDPYVNAELRFFRGFEELNLNAEENNKLNNSFYRNYYTTDMFLNKRILQL